MNKLKSTVTTNYANFRDRASRSEFWLYMLCYGIGLFIFMMIDIELFANGTAYLSSIYLVVLMIPTLAGSVRNSVSFL